MTTIHQRRAMARFPQAPGPLEIPGMRHDFVGTTASAGLSPTAASFVPTQNGVDHEQVRSVVMGNHSYPGSVKAGASFCLVNDNTYVAVCNTKSFPPKNMGLEVYDTNSLPPGNTNGAASNTNSAPDPVPVPDTIEGYSNAPHMVGLYILTGARVQEIGQALEWFLNSLGGIHIHMLNRLEVVIVRRGEYVDGKWCIPNLDLAHFNPLVTFVAKLIKALPRQAEINWDSSDHIRNLLQSHYHSKAHAKFLSEFEHHDDKGVAAYSAAIDGNILKEIAQAHTPQVQPEAMPTPDYTEDIAQAYTPQVQPEAMPTPDYTEDIAQAHTPQVQPEAMPTPDYTEDPVFHQQFREVDLIAHPTTQAPPFQPSYGPLQALPYNHTNGYNDSYRNQPDAYDPQYHDNGYNGSQGHQSDLFYPQYTGNGGYAFGMGENYPAYMNSGPEYGHNISATSPGYPPQSFSNNGQPFPGFINQIASYDAAMIRSLSARSSASRPASFPRRPDHNKPRKPSGKKRNYKILARPKEGSGVLAEIFRPYKEPAKAPVLDPTPAEAYRGSAGARGAGASVAGVGARGVEKGVWGKKRGL